ncbi:g10806 [Coccomyxa elongata]
MSFTSTLSRPRVFNRLRKCTAVLGGAGPQDSQGDPNVQEGLVQMVRLQIGKEKVKDSVEEEKLKLQQLAEEAKAEVDRLQQLTADRSTLAFGSALADINKSADEYEEVLRASRARAEAYSRELADWEVQTARARNEGTFFKGLFKADVLQRPEGGAGNASSQPSTSPAQVDSKETLSEDKYTDKDAALRTSSDVLKYSFSFLAFVLFGTVIGDLAGGSVSLGMDGRNFLLGLLLTYGAWKASQYS